MRTEKIDQRRILLIARAILVVTALVVGIGVFYVMKYQAEHQLIASLQSSLDNIVMLEDTEIRHGIEKSRMISTRPFLIAQLVKLQAHRDDPQALAALRRGANSFLHTGLSGIAFYDASGTELVRAGDFINRPEISVPVNVGVDARLLFEHRFFLHSVVTIEDRGKVIGKLVVELPLYTLERLFRSVRTWGKTAELAMCAPSAENEMNCFPSTLSDKVLHLSRILKGGVPLPMSYALNGERGWVITRDYLNKEVVAVYQPLESLGLGMVLKIDTHELYAPVWRQLRYLLPLLLVLMVAALLSLRWLLAPLVAGLVKSQREAYEANERLSSSESRMRTLVESVNEGIISISAAGIVELFNPGAERMFGYKSSEVVGRNVSMLMPEPFHSEHDAYLRRYRETGESQVVGHVREVEALRRDGSVFPAELRVSRLDTAEHGGFIGVLHDITRRKEVERQVAHFANYDPLTNLANRRLVQDRIEQAIVRAKRVQSQLALMFIDLDKFKQINDTLGHDAGDQLLQAVARRLTTCLRGEDTVGRQGGDEFIVLLARIKSVDDAAEVARKIIESLARPFSIMGHDLLIDASIGIATYPRDGTDFEELLRHSDDAMYSAKQSSTQRYRFFQSMPNDVPQE